MKEMMGTFHEATRVEIISLSLIYVCACAVLFMAFDDPVIIVEGCLFFFFLAAISFLDHKTAKIPSLTLIPLAATGLLNFDWRSLVGALIISVPMLLLTALFPYDAIGGGDIKFMAATGFVLRPERAIISALIGCLLFILVHWHQKHQKFPYAPCMSIGCFLAFLL